MLADSTIAHYMQQPVRVETGHDLSEIWRSASDHIVMRRAENVAWLNYCMV